MKHLLLLIFAWSLLPAAAEEDLSLTARRALKEYKDELARLKERYLEVERREREDLVEALEAEIEKQTKRGDLDGALKVRKLLAEVESGKWARLKPGMSGFNQQTLAEGRWEIQASIHPGKWRAVKFTGSGKVIYPPSAKGSYKINREGDLVITFDSGVVYRFRPETDNQGYFMGSRSKGGTLLLRSK